VPGEPAQLWFTTADENLCQTMVDAETDSVGGLFVCTPDVDLTGLAPGWTSGVVPYRVP
jgi:hypothetical protein